MSTKSDRSDRRSGGGSSSRLQGVLSRSHHEKPTSLPTALSAIESWPSARKGI